LFRVAAYAVPWSGVSTITHKKKVVWKLSVCGRFVGIKDNKQVALDTAFHYYKLYNAVLKILASSNAVLKWSGKLSGIVHTLEALMRPFCNLNHNVAAESRDGIQ
jgi:hypothetical protein